MNDKNLIKGQQELVKDEDPKQKVMVLRALLKEMQIAWPHHVRPNTDKDVWTELWENQTKHIPSQKLLKIVRSLMASREYPPTFSEINRKFFCVYAPSEAYALRHSDEKAIDAWESISSWDRQHKTERELREEFEAKYRLRVAKVWEGTPWQE